MEFWQKAIKQNSNLFIAVVKVFVKFISILQLINTIDGCKMKEKNIANNKSLYVVFENINTISEALKNLNRLQLIDN